MKKHKLHFKHTGKHKD